MDVEPDPDAGVSDLRIAYETGVVAAAGWTAQRRHLLETHQEVDEPLLRLAASQDLKAVIEMYGPGVFYEFAATAEARFNEGDNWAAVQRLAKELLAHRTIAAVDAEAILGPCGRLP